MLAMMRGRLCRDGSADTEEGWEAPYGVITGKGLLIGFHFPMNQRPMSLCKTANHRPFLFVD